MSKTNEYRVLRRHEGDRWYDEGDTRTAVANEVKHLVPLTLELIEDQPEEKAEPAPKNKAEGAAPANKASKGK